MEVEDILALRAQLGCGFWLIAVVSTILDTVMRGSLEFIKYTRVVRNLVDR